MEIPAPKPWIARLIRYFLGSAFVVAGSSKLFPLKVFYQQVFDYHFPLPEKFIYFGGLVLILLEIAIGLSILLNYHLKLGLLGMQILLVSMIPVTLWGTFHKAPACGCYGNLVRREPWKATVDDCLMLAVSFLLIPAVGKKKSPDKLRELTKSLILSVGVLSGFVWGAIQLNRILASPIGQ
jgi:uncharacterized membrane protein